jgi:nitroimidazol reductase NimA-like FMN-containing flavoprotein (pyridoxamine 5'-phosphate oxidase superfamily)
MFDERTGLEIIDEAECWKLLGSEEIGRIGVAIANRPDIYPVNYKVDSGDDQLGPHIVIHTVPGTKLAGAVLGVSVVFEVDNFHSGMRPDGEVPVGGAWSVILHGRAEEVEGVEELLRAGDLGIRPWTTAPKMRFLRIVPDDISGRRIPN